MVFTLFLITSLFISFCKPPTTPDPDIDIIDIPRQYVGIIVAYNRNTNKTSESRATIIFEYKLFDPDAFRNKKEGEYILDNFIIGSWSVVREEDNIHMYKHTFTKVLVYTDERFKEHEVYVYDWVFPSGVNYGLTAEDISIEVIGGGFRIEMRIDRNTLLFKLIPI